MESYKEFLWNRTGLPDVSHIELASNLGDRLELFLKSMTIWKAAGILCVFYWIISSFAAYRRIRVPGAPIHGYWTWFEPTWFMQMRYAVTAHNIISSGYLKVSISNVNINFEMYELRKIRVLVSGKAIRPSTPRS